MKKANILAHRGFWSDEIKQNSREALGLALQKGFGVETDLRDHSGKVVISHDMPIDGEYIELEEFFDLVQKFDEGQRIALNIKADGLQAIIKHFLLSYNLTERAFVFDMSVPDAIGYSRCGIPLYERVSEYEASGGLHRFRSGVWLDCFSASYDQVAMASSLTKAGIRTAFVSPELHGRAHLDVWEKLKSAKCVDFPSFEICTDYPQMAFDFFGGNGDD